MHVKRRPSDRDQVQAVVATPLCLSKGKRSGFLLLLICLCECLSREAAKLVPRSPRVLFLTRRGATSSFAAGAKGLAGAAGGARLRWRGPRLDWPTRARRVGL